MKIWCKMTMAFLCCLVLLGCKDSSEKPSDVSSSLEDHIFQVKNDTNLSPREITLYAVVGTEAKIEEGSTFLYKRGEIIERGVGADYRGIECDGIDLTSLKFRNSECYYFVPLEAEYKKIMASKSNEDTKERIVPVEEGEKHRVCLVFESNKFRPKANSLILKEAGLEFSYYSKGAEKRLIMKNEGSPNNADSDATGQKYFLAYGFPRDRQSKIVFLELGSDISGNFESDMLLPGDISFEEHMGRFFQLFVFRFGNKLSGERETNEKIRHLLKASNDRSMSMREFEEYIGEFEITPDCLIFDSLYTVKNQGIIVPHVEWAIETKIITEDKRFRLNTMLKAEGETNDEARGKAQKNYEFFLSKVQKESPGQMITVEKKEYYVPFSSKATINSKWSSVGSCPEGFMSDDWIEK